MPRGVPRRDGSGRGQRANKGRGGCVNPRNTGRGSGTQTGRGHPGKGQGRGRSGGRRGSSFRRR